jgi:glutamate formiminotransferase / 5-formyltetrahydrofolate cyclo-ligase
VLLAVPNVSEGRDEARIHAIEIAFGPEALLDVHSDPAHNRTVLTLRGEPDELAGALLNGARATVELIDLRRHRGAHPRVGALDVCPVVWLTPTERDAALAEAHGIAALIADELEVPVFLYGPLAASEERRERAFFRRGGIEELARRMASGELEPDRGPRRPHPSAGATLVTARPPLAAFNVELDTPDVAIAGAIASALRESSGGLPGVRAIGLALDIERTQISTNVHDPVAVPLAEVIAEIRRLAEPHGASPVAAEVVGLVPEASLEGLSEELSLGEFDVTRQVIERRLASLGGPED